MKTSMLKVKLVFLSVLMLATVLIAGAAEEGPGLMVKTVANRPSVYKVTFYGGDSGVVTLTVYSSKGKAVFQETLRNKEFIRLVNFEGMDSGTYTVEVKDGKNKVETKVEYTV